VLDFVQPQRPGRRKSRGAQLGHLVVGKLGLEGIVSKRKGSPYRSGRSPDWLKMKNPVCAAVKREEEEDWGR
jgi:ATP-dependent DNA ligase